MPLTPNQVLLTDRYPCLLTAPLPIPIAVLVPFPSAVSVPVPVPQPGPGPDLARVSPLRPYSLPTPLSFA